MSNTIKPLDQGMLTKLGDKSSGAKDVMNARSSTRLEQRSDSSAPPKSETVELTSGAQLLSRLDETLSTLPDIDTARVDAVKSAISSGDYEIDAEKIADAVLRADRELDR